MTVRDRYIVAREFIAAQRDAEVTIARCADLREELRQLSENQGSGFVVHLQGGDSVSVEWRGTGRPQVTARLA